MAMRRRNRRIRRAGRRGEQMLQTGMGLGQQILPEVFEGGSGLDRVDFGGVDFDAINQYLQPSVNEAQGLMGETRGGYDELMDMRRGRLGGLMSDENQALRESYYRPIDRERAGAMRDIARTPGLGAGASFAQRRAINRDYGDARLGAERQLLLDNIGIKRQALGDFEASLGARTGALGQAQDRLSGLRGLQATGQQATDQFNTQGNFLAQQFNAGQQGKELGARIGAISTGTGLVGDERDKIQANKLRKQLMDFLAERDQSVFSQAQALLG